MKLLVIGAGNMGMSYAEGIAKSDIGIEKPILLLDADQEKINSLNSNSNFYGSTEVEGVVGKADFILMAVKPQQFKHVAASIRPFLKRGCAIISIMAGIKIETIVSELGLSKVARAMPNLPAQIGLGMTSVFYTQQINQSTKEVIDSILASTGEVIAVPSEDFIDKSTGISGSGPAYIFYFIEALEKAAEGMGFSKTDSQKLATQTFLGAVELYKQGNISPAEWMYRVASKGGTTQAALNTFEAEDISNRIIKGAFSAYKRAVELGKE